LDHVVDTGETTTSTTYYEPRYQWSGGISPERLLEGPALLLDEIDQSDAANADGNADVGNLGPLDAPARLLGDDDTSTTTYIPIKVNQAGVIPVIFASSLLYLPAPYAQFRPGDKFSSWISTNFVKGDHPIYILTFFLLIVFFAYFYVAITFNPNEVADNMKKY